MSVILPHEPHKEEDVQVNEMALLTELVDLTFISYFRSSMPVRLTHTSSYAVTALKYRYCQTLLGQHLGTPESRNPSSNNANYARFTVSIA